MSDGFLSRWSRRKAQADRSGSPDEVALSAQVLAPTDPVRPEPGSPIELGLSKQGPSTSPGRTPEALAHQASPSSPSTPPALPTLDDVAQLSRDSDFRRFVAADVTPEVKNAALKKLFADPQFNVMDGLDTYIDDYGKPDPIPASMLRQMVQAQFLGLFDDEKEADKVPTAGAIPDGAMPTPEPQSRTAPMLAIANDQDPALRLQPLDAAGPPGDPGGAEQDTGRQR